MKEIKTYPHENTGPGARGQPHSPGVIKMRGEMTGGRPQLPASQSKKAGAFNRPTVIFSSNGRVRLTRSLRPKYCETSFIAVRLTRNCRFARKKPSPAM